MKGPAGVIVRLHVVELNLQLLGVSPVVVTVEKGDVFAFGLLEVVV